MVPLMLMRMRMLVLVLVLMLMLMLRLKRLAGCAALMFADCQQKMRERRAFHRLNFIRLRLLQPLRLLRTHREKLRHFRERIPGNII